MREWRKTHGLSEEQKEHVACRLLTKSYIQRGLIKKAPCIICGTTENIEIHHMSYHDPFDVVSICRPHHVLHTQGFLDLPESIRRWYYDDRGVEGVLGRR
jgi:hypothetical protein